MKATIAIVINTIPVLLSLLDSHSYNPHTRKPNATMLLRIKYVMIKILGFQIVALLNKAHVRCYSEAHGSARPTC